MTLECDNKWNSHDPITVADDGNATRVICNHCKHQYVLKKTWTGVHENRAYSKIYKRDIIQPRENLFYKIYPKYLLQ